MLNCVHPRKVLILHSQWGHSNLVFAHGCIYWLFKPLFLDGRSTTIEACQAICVSWKVSYLKQALCWSHPYSLNDFGAIVLIKSLVLGSSLDDFGVTGGDQAWPSIVYPSMTCWCFGWGTWDPSTLGEDTLPPWAMGFRSVFGRFWSSLFLWQGFATILWMIDWLDLIRLIRFST